MAKKGPATDRGALDEVMKQTVLGLLGDPEIVAAVGRLYAEDDDETEEDLDDGALLGDAAHDLSRLVEVGETLTITIRRTRE